jgi:UDP-N-acetylmuramyl-tripeptide synthetase/UDP-N-acetylmuramoyl-tripeptide--D-alanyl-D-alanine ligase
MDGQMKLAELAPDILTLDPALRRIPITGVTADSREVAPGTLFVALPGTRAKGTDFIPEAIEKGAAAVLADLDDELPAGLTVPVLRDPDPARRFARMLARFYAPQPKTVVAVTGTNGKTSVAAFVRQIWLAAGHEAASIGTVGVTTRAGNAYGNMTTPDAATLHRTLHELAADGIDHVAMEASSHGLIQRRLDGVEVAAGAFTNLSRDHLDYHGTMEAYMAAKMRLFDTILAPGAGAVVNLDDPYGEAFASAARISGLDLMTVGAAGTFVRILDVARDGWAQIATVDIGGGPRPVRIPLVGAFQVSNALVAATLAAATGSVSLSDALDALEGIKGAKGRLELTGYAPSEAPVFVDFAHTPAALEVALQTLRPFTTGRLVVAFGAGGDRDKGKRPQMGEVCARLADVAIVTDDNPRTENAATIRSEVLAGCPGGIEIGDRATAVREGIAMLGPDDVLLIAGKGHETGQIIGREVVHYSDHEAVLATPGVTPADRSLWLADDFARSLAGRTEGTLSAIDGISIDSRTVAKGDAFFAIAGDRFDGHDFVAAAFEKGAAVAVVSEEKRATVPNDAGPLVVVDDVLAGLRRLGIRARERTAAKVIAVTGSVGKTSTKEALREALAPSGAVHASAASFNNHWGVPLTLARMPAGSRYGVFEIGMNHAGEITPLVRMVRPHVAVVTTVAPVHLEHFSSVEAIAEAKAEIFAGLEPGGTAIINRDGEFSRLLAERAQAHGASVVFFGEHPQAAARLIKCSLHEDCTTATADILGETVTYKLGAPGRHIAQNSLAVLAAVKIVGGDLTRALLALQAHQQPKGRGKRHLLAMLGGTARLIDESYNANPTSMRAAIALLGAATVEGQGRRVAVLGDMLELGPEAPKLHAGLVEPLKEARVDTVFCAGPLMHNLWQELPRAMRGAYAETSKQLREALLDDVRAGDVLMVKGSLGSAMGPLVDALLGRFGQETHG